MVYWIETRPLDLELQIKIFFLSNVRPPDPDTNHVSETGVYAARAGMVAAALQHVPNQPVTFRVSHPIPAIRHTQIMLSLCCGPLDNFICIRLGFSIFV